MIIKKFDQYETLLLCNNIYYSKAIAGLISFVIVYALFSVVFNSALTYYQYIIFSPKLFLILTVSFFITLYTH